MIQTVKYQRLLLSLGYGGNQAHTQHKPKCAATEATGEVVTQTPQPGPYCCSAEVFTSEPPSSPDTLPQNTLVPSSVALTTVPNVPKPKPKPPKTHTLHPRDNTHSSTKLYTHAVLPASMLNVSLSSYEGVMCCCQHVCACVNDRYCISC